MAMTVTLGNQAGAWDGKRSLLADVDKLLVNQRLQLMRILENSLTSFGVDADHADVLFDPLLQQVAPAAAQVRLTHSAKVRSSINPLCSLSRSSTMSPTGGTSPAPSPARSPTISPTASEKTNPPIGPIGHRHSSARDLQGSLESFSSPPPPTIADNLQPRVMNCRESQESGVVVLPAEGRYSQRLDSLRDPPQEDVRPSAAATALASTFSKAMWLERLTALRTPRNRAVKSISTLHTSWLSFLRSERFDLAICAIIVTNTLFFGVEVEYMARTLQTDLPLSMKAVAWGYTLFFTTELFLRVLTEGLRGFVCSKMWGWNILDTLLVLVSAVEFLIDFYAGADTGGGNSGGANFTYLRALRIARMVRILRIVRVMKYLRSLRVLIYSVLNTLRSLMWTLVLLVVIIYVFGLIFTQSTVSHRMEMGDEGVDPRLLRYFGNLERASLTLFMCISNGLSWQNAAESLGDLHPSMLAFFLMFIAFTFFAVLNVVTGVFCQTAIESANADQDMVIQAQMAMKNRYIDKLETLFKRIDRHSTGYITLSEFEASMREEWFKAYFATIDITVDEAFSLFKLLDTDDNRAIDIDAFVTGCLRYRGSAKSVDIAIMSYESRWTLQKVMDHMRDFDLRLDSLQQQLQEEGSLPGTPLSHRTSSARLPKHESALATAASQHLKPPNLKVARVASQASLQTTRRVSQASLQTPRYSSTASQQTCGRLGSLESLKEIATE